MVTFQIAGEWASRFPPAYSESFSFGEMIVAKDDFGYAMAGRAFDYTPAGTGYDFQLIQMDEAGQTPSACYEKALVKATTVEWCQERLKPLSLDAVDEMTVTPDWQPLSITDTTCS